MKLIQGLLLAFIGLGALGGGAYLMFDPSGNLIGLPLEYLKGSPFQNYSIPGVVLFFVIGIGNLIGSILTFKKHRYSGKIGMTLGLILLTWMLVQIISIGYKMWIQGLFTGISIVLIWIGYRIIYSVTPLKRSSGKS